MFYELKLPSDFKCVGLPLKVLHQPQIQCKAFEVPVADEREAFKIAEVLAKQHLWLFEEHIIPDYCNAIFVVMREGDEWVDYYNDHHELEWDDLVTEYASEP